MRVELMTAEEHDRMTAYSQGITHYVGRLFADLGLQPDYLDDMSQEERAAALDTAFDNLWWMVLIELAKNDADGARVSISELESKAGTANLADHMRIPIEYGDRARNATDRPFATVFAKRAYIDAINQRDGEHRLGATAAIIEAPLRAETLNLDASTKRGDTPPEATTDTTVVAVIDNGIAVGHDLFRRRDNQSGALIRSRVDFFWNMDAPKDTSAAVPSSMGRVWTREDIEKLLDCYTSNGLLDEAKFYDALGLIDWRRGLYSACAQRVSHGTHVAGLAAGYRADEDTGETRRIIAVQLPTTVLPDTGGSQLKTPLEQALLFIATSLDQYKCPATEPGTTKTPPLAINFSFGNFAGPHDGTGFFERLIDHEMSKMNQHCDGAALMHLPSGNGNLARCHAQIALNCATPKQTLDWHIQPEDRSSSSVQAWLPKEAVLNGSLKLTVGAPGSVNSGSVSAEQNAADLLLTGGGFTLGHLSFRPPKPPTDRGCFVLNVVPTAHPANVGPVAPAGAWTLTQQESLQQILSHLLLRLSIGPADQETADALIQCVKEAVKTINDNLAFTLEELLAKIEAV